MLNTSQLAKATTQNPIWADQLASRAKWPNVTAFSAVGVNAGDPSSAAFAQGVASYQASKGLVVDGICGPQTASQIIHGKPAPEPTGSDHFFFQGKPIEVSGLRSITTPDEPEGLPYRPDYPGCWVRTQPIDLVVIHAKGAEGSAQMTWSYLKSKKLGVHGSVERDGRVWAYTDFGKHATAHAGAVNQNSVGFEVTNTMYPLAPNPYKRPTVVGDYVIRDPGDPQFGKAVPRKVQGFLPPQVDSLVKLITAVCEVSGLPKVIPGRNGKLYGGLLPGFRPKAGQWKSVTGKTTFRGVIGHYHCTNGHQDPSPDVFEALLKAGFRLQEV